MPIPFPRRHLASLHDLASRVLESRPADVDSETLARDLVTSFQDFCTRVGLDGVVVELEPVVGDVSGLAARLGDKANYDARGPRTAKPRQLIDCLLTALSIELVDPPDRTITLTDELRREVVAALAGVIEVELASPQMREAIITAARRKSDPRHAKAFEKITSSLDERGLRGPPQPKLPLDGVQAVQKALFDARAEVIGRAANAAIDKGKVALARGNPEAAERIDQPITHKLTPRDVAITRAVDVRSARSTESVIATVLDTITELAELAWPAAVQTVKPYAASQSFAVGDVLEHPKFGRGTVKAVALQRIDVEFPDGTYTLVHARGK